MLFYIIVFLTIGFVIGLFTKSGEVAYPVYGLIAIVWFFVWGPYAVLAFIELVLGDYLARRIKSIF